MIIDCHTHLNNYHDETVADIQGCLHRLQTAMRRNRVDAALVLTSYKVSPGRPSTAAVIEAVEAASNLYVIAGISWSTFSQADVDALRGFLEAGTIKGLKIYPGYEPFYPADEKLAPAYRLAEEFDVPVMIHTGDTYDPRGKVKYAHPLEVDEVAVDFPEVTFVICHLGNPWVTDAMEVIYKNENVVADISGFTLKHFEERFERYMLNQVREVIDFAGDRSRLLFGTDWPICDIASYIRFVNKLELSEREMEQIFWRNSERVFHLDIREDGAQSVASA